MKYTINDRRTWLIVGLLLGLVALAADRGWIWAPAATRAEPADLDDRSSAADADLNATSPGMPDRFEAPDSPENSRLAAWRRHDGVRDLFQPAPGMLARLRGEADPSSRSTLSPKLDLRQRAETFQTTHHLQATFGGPSGFRAVIDGELFRTGDRLDGFRVTEIENMKVRFERETITVVLVMPVTPATRP